MEECAKNLPLCCGEQGVDKNLFNSSVDALQYVIRNRSVSQVQARIGYSSNGIRHCSVQLLCEDSAGYGIEAYGKEAEDLFREASKHSKEAQDCMTVA